MNNDMLRLAIVINTSHSVFWYNLCNVIIYVLYVNRDEKNSMSESEIKNGILNKLYLEFTEKEIKLAVNRAHEAELITRIGDSVCLSEKGLKKIHHDNEQKIDTIIKRYKHDYSIDNYSGDKIKELIFDYIYCHINEDIGIIENMINGRVHVKECCNDKMMKYTNQEREIVNNFLDWPDIEKNDVINKLLYFAVDYCRMTVRKDSSSFGDFLKGKKFYLDTNIIFRLMGLNGENRQKTMQDFIDKCKEVNIKILYTNVTRQEAFESFQFHTNRIRENKSKLKVKEEKYFKLIRATYQSDGINEKYHNWAIKNNTFGKYGDFIKYLKREFFACVSTFELETYEDSGKQKELAKDLTKRLRQYKEDSTGDANIEYDIQNILHVEKKRELSGNENSWNNAHYFISADHNLISWTTEDYKRAIPIVVLPSVWYSMILKVTGRTKEELKSFVEFIKMKYIQSNNDSLGCLINCIRDKTDNRILQEMMIDDLVDNNVINNNVTNVEYEDVVEIVDEAYMKAIETTKKEGFDSGYSDGLEKGKQEGYGNGTAIGIHTGLLRGVELGGKKARFEMDLVSLEKEVQDNIKKRLLKRKILRRIFVPFCWLVGSGLIYLIIYKRNDWGSIGNGVLSAIINLIIVLPNKYFIEPIIIKTEEAIREEEHKKKDEERQAIELQIDKIKEEIKNRKSL